MWSRRSVLATLAAPALRGQERKSEIFGDAEAYERVMGRWSRILAPQLVAFSDLPDSGQVLDVGSGTGALALSVATLKPHCQVVGIDPSRPVLDSAIHVPAVANLHDDDGRLGIIDGIQHSIVSLANAILFLAGEFLSAGGAWFGGQIPDLGGDSPAVLGRQGLEFLRSRWLDEQPITCHAASGLSGHPRRPG